MDVKEFAGRVLTALPYQANEQQVAVVAALAKFCAPASRSDAVFILNGYAGTGKTSLTGALVRTLASVGIRSVLLAPTGRAAKVFSANSSGHPAFTIHRKIYRHSSVIGEQTDFSLAPVRENKHKNTIFIVDEASMIASGTREDSPDILADLVQYVYTGENCRLILLGDTAQLPPVGTDSSPAMEADVLRRFGLKVTHATLTETARQAAGSGILYNATRLRRAMLRLKEPQNDKDSVPVPKIVTSPFADVSIVDSEELADRIEQAYAEDGPEETIIICRSNRRAADYNAAIRSQVLYREEILSAGDMLIVAKNHYFTSEKVKGLDFVANGDILAVERVYGTETRYGLRFADVRLSTVLPGNDTAGAADAVEFDAKVILDALGGESAALSREQLSQLYYGILYDPDAFSSDTPADTRLRALRTDPYWNALQVKYAYAVTCHKAQGGQWRNVFVDLSYIPPESLGMELYRWMYTAVTRARSRLFLISPPEKLVGK